MTELKRTDAAPTLEQAFADASCPMRVKGTSPEPPRVDALHLMKLSLIRVVGGPFQFDRDARTIGDHDPEQLLVLSVEQGTVRLSQGEVTSRIGAGRVAICRTGRPFAITPEAECAIRIGLFPRSLIRLPDSRISHLFADLAANEKPSERMLAVLFDEVLQHERVEASAPATYYIDAFLDLVAAHFAEMLQPGPDDVTGSRRSFLLIQTREFIEQRLWDPDLDPQVIADHHHISLRYLHKLFASIGLTVSGWIRATRLERCRRDLANPALASLKISAIGARWGIPNATVLSRLFHEHYGMTPSQYRAAVRNGIEPELQELDEFPAT
ncbi:helix-turn-helix domain-containing protein [Agromyces bauzanensis]